MKKQFLLIALLTLLITSLNAQWSVTSTNAWSYGCPGYICINGPITGYTFAINPPPLWGPNLPGSCGGAEYAVWAGTYNVNIIQNSNGSVVASYYNIQITQPSCALGILSPTVTSGCYNNNTLTFGINGFFCGSGNVTLNKNGTYLSGYTFNSPGQYDFSNLTPGAYQLIVADNLCSDNYSFTINDNCAAPASGFSATSIAKTSATINWATQPCAVSYMIQYRPKTSTTWVTKYTANNTGLKSLTGLTAGTTYKWRVKSKCNVNPVSTSMWSAVQTFKTSTPREGDASDLPSQNSISVFPNPATNNLNVVCDFEIDKNAQLTLIDNNGKEIEIEYTRSGENEINADIASVANGIYQLRLINSDAVFTQKVVVIK